MAKKITTKDILQLLVAMGASGAPLGPSATIMSGALGGLVGNVGGTGRGGDGSASGYPEEFAPDNTHNYNVVYAPRPDGVEGPYQNMNYMGKANAATIAEAAEQQSLKEHNEALTKYVRMLPSNATPKQIRDAIQQGRDEEKQLPKWWNESNNRREFSVSSSAVKGIRITPEGNIEVQWGGKPSKKNPSGWYTFKRYGNTHEASKAARELLESDSIGRAVYPVVSRPTKNPLLGAWNKNNYDAAYAK